MKQLLFLLSAIILLPVNALLAQSSDVPSAPLVTSRTFKFTPANSDAANGVKVTWSFVNTDSDLSGSDCAFYNGILTIQNETPNDIRDWRVNILVADGSSHNIGDQIGHAACVEGVTHASGFVFETFSYDTGSDNFIPAMGSLTIPFSALAYGKIHTPKHVSFEARAPFSPSKDQNFSPYYSGK